MSDFDKWRDTVLTAAGVEKLEDLEAPLPGSDKTYPILVADVDVQPQPTEKADRWGVRVVLSEPLGEEAMEALRESTAEVVVRTGPPDTEEAPVEGPLSVTYSGGEARVVVDLNLLRNVAELRRLRESSDGSLRWILVSNGLQSEDPENLVSETIRQLTGVLGGCDLLEIHQGVDETFTSLWSRVNVARIMEFEAELQGTADPITGAGLFRELQLRL